MKPARSPWAVLSAGFGGLLVFIAVGATASLLTLGRVQDDETGIRTAYLERLEVLNRIRSQIYLSGTYVRDYLLSPDAAGQSAQAQKLAATKQESISALDEYARRLEPEERETFASLQNEINAYWRVLDGTLVWNSTQRSTLRYPFFYEELIPRRTAMLQIADRITAADERGLARAEQRLGASAQGLRNTLLLTFGITLMGGIVLAVLTILSTLRLERDLETKLAENDRARAELRDLSARLVRTQEAERRSLARELHDEVGQSLTAILMEAGALQGGDSIRSMAEKTVNQVRDIALLLRPSMLDDFGLVAALKWHGREVAKRSGMKVIVSADERSNELSDEHKTCVYRLVQEALSNASRHAGARSIEVRVVRRDHDILCEVEDDGIGFDAAHTRGMGILGMEERTARLGGAFHIRSEPGKGAAIQAVIPLASLTNGN